MEKLVEYPHVYTLYLEKDNLVRVYNDGYKEVTLKRIPKKRETRIALLRRIERAARDNHYNCKTPYLQQCENPNSRRNKYFRQWEDLVTLIHGINEFGNPNVDYDFGDVLA